MSGKVVLVLDAFGEPIYVPVTVVDAELDMEVDAEENLTFEATEEELPSA